MLYSLMYFLRFIRSLFALNSRGCSNKLLSKFSFTGQFSAKDFHLAEILALKQAQTRSTLAHHDKIKRNFALFTDPDGILRSKNRLQWSSLPPASVDPIYLPWDDRLSALIVLDTHKRHFHAGVQQTHYQILQKFCGLTKRNIRQILGQCLEYKRRNALPYSLPAFPPYPLERVTP